MSVPTYDRKAFSTTKREKTRFILDHFSTEHKFKDVMMVEVFRYDVACKSKSYTSKRLGFLRRFIPDLARPSLQNSYMDEFSPNQEDNFPLFNFLGTRLSRTCSALAYLSTAELTQDCVKLGRYSTGSMVERSHNFEHTTRTLTTVLPFSAFTNPP